MHLGASDGCACAEFTAESGYARARINAGTDVGEIRKYAETFAWVGFNCIFIKQKKDLKLRVLKWLKFEALMYYFEK